MPRSSLVGLLEDAARWGEQTALSRQRGLRLERWSWGRLRGAAYRIARVLESRGVGPGHRVVLRAAAGPEWVAGFWGCLARGAVVVPLDVEGPPGFAEGVSQQVGARLTVDDGFLADSAVGGPGGDRSPSPRPDVGGDDLAEIVFTSGTTSEPKGVCLTHGNLLASIEPFAAGIARHRRVARAVGPLRFLCPLPVTHVFGQISAVFIPPLLGAEVHFPRSLKARELVDSARRRRVNVMPCVPRQLELLREHVEREARRRGRLSSLEQDLARADEWWWPRRWWAFRRVRRAFGWRFWVFASGGASLSRETEVFWRRLGYVVLQGYGLTETAALATLNDPYRSDRGSIGRPLPGTEIRVAEGGQVLVRGPAVSPGYWSGGVRPVAAEDGWLPTGDLVERDPSGALYFKGRAKEVIVTSSGQNLFPEDLEAALDAQPEVRASAVVPFDGPSGPEPVAVLLLDGEGRERVVEILARANARLAPHQHLRRALVWEGPDLPRTGGTWKVRRAELAGWVKRCGESPGRDGAPSASPLAPLITAAGGEAPAGMDSEARLDTDLKLDSLGQFELLSALEERYQVDIDESVLRPETTLGDLERLLTGDGAPSGALYPYPAWAQHPIWRGVRLVLQALIVLPLARALCWVRVRGAEYLRSLAGPVLFVCNHVSMVDGGLVVSALPWRIRHRLAIAMSGEILRDWRHPPDGDPWPRRIWGPPLYAVTALLFGVFSLPQKSGFRRSFAFAGEAVDRGQNLLVFPEGRRTPDGRLQSFQGGVGLLVAGLQVTVVPLRIDGLFALKQRRRHWARPGEVTISFGAPVPYQPGTDAAAITADLERRVGALAQASRGRAVISSM